MSKLCIWTATAIAATACSLTATAADIYVSNELGNDSFDGAKALPDSDRSGPVRTIGRALRLANRGDHIVVHATDEPYRECLTLAGARHSGTANRPFTMSGNGAILDGSVPVPDHRWTHYRGSIFRYRPVRQTFLQLFFEEKPLTEVRVPTGAARIPALKPLEWCLFETHVYFRVEKDKTPSDYQLTQTGDVAGITLYRVRNVAMADFILQGYQLDGVNAHDDATGVLLERFTCRGNGRSGISIGGASGVALRKCLIGNNGRAQVRAESPARVEVVASEILDNTAPPFVNEGAELVVDGQPLPAGAQQP